MIEQSFDEKLQKEAEDLKNLRISDINGRRLVSNFTVYINNSLEQLAGVEDPQVLLTEVISLIRRTPKILEDISSEVNATRRELAARIQAISDCRDVLIETIKKQTREEERVREVADKIKESDGVEPRKIGDRPVKLKDVRKAQELISEEELEAEEEADPSEPDGESEE